ncbi:MAG: hypothetical protein EXR66_04485 [Dehalococcoidia bacterium]|nr:hypothetical protein [Dehalococcoidia bacterium]
MNPEEREELLAAYALGTLSAGDMEAVEDIVHTDRVAAADLESYHEIVDSLALSVPLRRADTQLRTRVMDAARRESSWRRAYQSRRELVVWFTGATAFIGALAWGVQLERDMT